MLTPTRGCPACARFAASIQRVDAVAEEAVIHHFDAGAVPVVKRAQAMVGWHPSMCSLQAAGLPSLVAQAQAAAATSALPQSQPAESSMHSAAAASCLPISGSGLMPAASLLRSRFQAAGSPLLQHAAASAAEYAQERVRHMMAMVVMPDNSLRPSL